MFFIDGQCIEVDKLDQPQLAPKGGREGLTKPILVFTEILRTWLFAHV
jgi:hypothetical protein